MKQAREKNSKFTEMSIIPESKQTTQTTSKPVFETEIISVNTSTAPVVEGFCKERAFPGYTDVATLSCMF